MSLSPREKPSLKENPLLSAKGGHPTSPKRRRKAFRHRKSKKLRIQAGTKSEMTKGIAPSLPFFTNRRLSNRNIVDFPIYVLIPSFTERAEGNGSRSLV
jgi:hypothetical protein